VRLACHVASALCRLGRAAEALALLRPLRAWVGEQPDDELNMLWHGDWAATLGHLGRLSEAVAAYDAARAAARRTGRADAEGRLMMNAAVTLRQGGQLDRALALSREGRALSDGDPSDASHQRIASLVVARDEAETGCFGPALAALEATLPGFEASGAVFWAQACRLVLVPLWLSLGQPARAVPLAPEPTACRPGCRPTGCAAAGAGCHRRHRR
jgi:ATP/maltotriose-dependent transcriptional regulator MalT